MAVAAGGSPSLCRRSTHDAAVFHQQSPQLPTADGGDLRRPAIDPLAEERPIGGHELIVDQLAIDVTRR